METNNRTSFLYVGTCSLHLVHTAFRNGLKKLGFDVDEFFYDIHFFFRYSDPHKENYASIEESTEVVAW